MTGVAAPGWLVLAWRRRPGPAPQRHHLALPAPVGAALLTPGAAILPLRQDLQEQLDWLAQVVEEQGGDAWVLPVTELCQFKERRVRDQMRVDRQADYEELRTDARAFLVRASDVSCSAGCGWHAQPGGCWHGSRLQR